MKKVKSLIIGVLLSSTALYLTTSHAHPTQVDNRGLVGISEYKRNHNKFILNGIGNMVNVDLIAYTSKNGDVTLISGEILPGIFPSQSGYEILQQVYGVPGLPTNTLAD